MNAYLEAAIPETGYVHDYVEWASRTSMSPPEFHLAACLAQMATLCGNRILLPPIGGKAYPPHLWLVLLGRAGAARKSSAISLATSMLAEVGDYRLPTEMTREAMWALLSERPTGIIEMTEFMSFLHAARHDYMSGIEADMCRWFDSPPAEERVLRSERYIVRSPAVTILGAAVARTLAEYTRAREFEGGFLSRFLFVPQTSSVSYRGMTEFTDPMRRELVERLRAIARAPELSGPVSVVTFGAEAYRHWEVYDRTLAASEELIMDELSGFASRAGVYAAKLAVCYALGRSGSVVPTAADVDNATALVDYCRGQLDDLLASVDAAASVDGRDIMHTLRHLRRLVLANGNSWIPYSALLRATHFKTRRLEDVVGTLVDSGTIEMRVEQPAVGRPRKDVRLKESA